MPSNEIDISFNSGNRISKKDEFKARFFSFAFKNINANKMIFKPIGVSLDEEKIDDWRVFIVLMDYVNNLMNTSIDDINNNGVNSQHKLLKVCFPERDLDFVFAIVINFVQSCQDYISYLNSIQLLSENLSRESDNVTKSQQGMINASLLQNIKDTKKTFSFLEKSQNVYEKISNPDKKYSIIHENFIKDKNKEISIDVLAAKFSLDELNKIKSLIKFAKKNKIMDDINKNKGEMSLIELTNSKNIGMILHKECNNTFSDIKLIKTIDERIKQNERKKEEKNMINDQKTYFNSLSSNLENKMDELKKMINSVKFIQEEIKNKISKLNNETNKDIEKNYRSITKLRFRQKDFEGYKNDTQVNKIQINEYQNTSIKNPHPKKNSIEKDINKLSNNQFILISSIMDSNRNFEINNLIKNQYMSKNPLLTNNANLNFIPENSLDLSNPTLDSNLLNNILNRGFSQIIPNYNYMNYPIDVKNIQQYYDHNSIIYQPNNNPFLNKPNLNNKNGSPISSFQINNFNETYFNKNILSQSTHNSTIPDGMNFLSNKSLSIVDNNLNQNTSFHQTKNIQEINKTIYMRKSNEKGKLNKTRLNKSANNNNSKSKIDKLNNNPKIDLNQNQHQNTNETTSHFNTNFKYHKKINLIDHPRNTLNNNRNLKIKKTSREKLKILNKMNNAQKISQQNEIKKDLNNSILINQSNIRISSKRKPNYFKKTNLYNKNTLSNIEKFDKKYSPFLSNSFDTFQDDDDLMEMAVNNNKL